MEQAVSIERFTVGNGRLVCVIRLAPWAPRCTTPELAARASGEFPHLAHHACVNGEDPTFGAVMDRTSLPHLLEHMVIELQTRWSQVETDVFVGTTDWLDETAGAARIQVSFTDDLMVLRAFRDAVEALNRLVVLP